MPQSPFPPFFRGQGQSVSIQYLAPFPASNPSAAVPRLLCAVVSQISAVYPFSSRPLYTPSHLQITAFFLQLARQSDTITVFLNVALLNVSPARQQRVGLALRPACPRNLLAGVRCSDSDLSSEASQGEGWKSEAQRRRVLKGRFRHYA